MESHWWYDKDNEVIREVNLVKKDYGGINILTIKDSIFEIEFKTNKFNNPIFKNELDCYNYAVRYHRDLLAKMTAERDELDS